MDRAAWLKEKRQRCEERMDTLFAPHYDEHWGYIYPTHRALLGRFLALCPPQGIILDAACGTGKYWPLILESGCSVIGIDQSSGMLAQARVRFPTVSTEKRGMQDIVYLAAFDGVICVDALENISPEDWPLVLGNLRRALKRAGLLYCTVELAPPEHIAAAFAASKALGLPVVEGEWAHEGGYHYYPAIEQVGVWMRDAGFERIEEQYGDDYYHLLARTRE